MVRAGEWESRWLVSIPTDSLCDLELVRLNRSVFAKHFDMLK